MFGLIFKLALSTFAIMTTAYLVPGVEVRSIWVGVVVALVIGVINTFLKPILKIITFPVNILSLGIFSLILNGGLILLADKLVAGFSIPTFFTAVIFAVVLSILNSFLNLIKD